MFSFSGVDSESDILPHSLSLLSNRKIYQLKHMHQVLLDAPFCSVVVGWLSADEQVSEYESGWSALVGLKWKLD